MTAEHVLTLDAGTSGARCVILRPGEGVVAAASRDWCYATGGELGPFGKSFDPGAFWAILVDLIRQALAKARLSGTDVAAVGLTSQRQGIVVLDDAGKSLYAGPNIDARAAAQGLAIDAKFADKVYASTGKLPSLLMAPARLRWLREQNEADFKRAACVLTIGDWMAYRLTDERVAERSLAGGCGLLNIASGERNGDLLAELDVPERLLPPLIDAGAVAGEVTSQAADETGLAAGTPVAVSGADTQCALLGLGVEAVGEVGVVTGSSCPVQQVTDDVRLHPQRRTWGGLHVVPERYVVESNASDAGAMWRWWCETLLGKGPHALDDGASLAAEAAPGAGGAVALLGPSAMNAGAMGLRLGGVLMTTPLSTASTGRAELLRAALENVAYALRANVEQAESVSGLPAKRIALGGGLTRAVVFPTILAGALGRPLDVAQQHDVTACGAAVLAARAAGLDEASLRAPMVTVQPEEDVIEVYERGYARWRRLGDMLEAQGLS